MSFLEALQLCQKKHLTISELQQLRSFLRNDVEDALHSRIIGKEVHQLIRATISARNLPALQLVHELTRGTCSPATASETSLAFAIQERWLSGVLVLLNDEKDIIHATDLHLSVLAHDPGHNITLNDLLVKDDAGYGVLEYAACAKNFAILKSAVSLALNAETVPDGVKEAFISAFPHLPESSMHPCADVAICSLISPLRLKFSFPGCDTHSTDNGKPCQSHDVFTQSQQVPQDSSSSNITNKSITPPSSNCKEYNAPAHSLSSISPLKTSLQKQQSLMSETIIPHLLQSNDYSDHVRNLISAFYHDGYKGNIQGTSFSANNLYNYLNKISDNAPLLSFYKSLLSSVYPNVCLHYIDFELYVFRSYVVPSEIGLVKTYNGRPVYALQGLFSADVTTVPKKMLDSVVKITGIEYNINTNKHPWLSNLSYTDWTSEKVRKCINWFLDSSPQALDEECTTQSLITPVKNKYILSKLHSLIKSFKDNQLPLQSQTGCTLYKHRSGLYLYRFHVDINSPLPSFPHAKYKTDARPKPLLSSSGKIVVFGKGINAEVKSLDALNITRTEVHEVQEFFSPFVPMDKLAVIARPALSCAEPYCVDHEIINEHTTLCPRKDDHFHCGLYDALQLSFCIYKWLHQLVTPDLIRPNNKPI